MMFLTLALGGLVVIGISWWWWPQLRSPFSSGSQYVHNTRSPHLSSSCRRQPETSNLGGRNHSSTRLIDLDQQVGSTRPVKEQLIQESASKELKSAQFEKECLEEHNRLRAIHDAPPLTLSRDLCNYAQDWANHLAKTERMEHRSKSNYGENLYMSSGMKVDARIPVKTWYDEIKFYKYGSDFSPSTGHFTQVVWKDTKEMGCAFAKKRDSVFVVANYNPPGNYRSRFPENVLPPKK